jgi:hypothetical protein
MPKEPNQVLPQPSNVQLAEEMDLTGLNEDQRKVGEVFFMPVMGRLDKLHGELEKLTNAPSKTPRSIPSNKRAQKATETSSEDPKERRAFLVS